MTALKSCVATHRSTVLLPHTSTDPRHARLAHPLTTLPLHDADVLSCLAAAVRRRAVSAHLLAGCDSGALHLASKAWRVGGELGWI